MVTSRVTNDTLHTDIETDSALKPAELAQSAEIKTDWKPTEVSSYRRAHRVNRRAGRVDARVTREQRRGAANIISNQGARDLDQAISKYRRQQLATGSKSAITTTEAGFAVDVSVNRAQSCVTDRVTSLTMSPIRWLRALGQSGIAAIHFNSIQFNPFGSERQRS